jgi:ABC-2 type transport system ATP-binding protein
MLCGLLTPDAGSGTCLGYDIVRETAAIKREVGYMTQKFGLYEDLTIRENLDFIARLYRVPARANAVRESIERLGLENRQHQLAGELSGGWKQRLALAACLLHAPRLLLLDEPTAGVDPKARRDFWDQIHELAAAGMTVLVSTHYMDEAERCHKLAYLAFGRLLSQGTAREMVEGSGLVTWSLAGTTLASLVHEIRSLPGVDMVVSFGAALHVSGTDAARLEQSLRPYFGRSDLAWTQIEPGLEDVFISLMVEARDNFER